jgi:hypothetical protein
MWLPDVITSTPQSRRVSPMSLVTPKPAAAFSAFATTRSTPCRSTSRFTPMRIISRPGFPMMSPMNRMFIRARCPVRPQ